MRRTYGLTTYDDTYPHPSASGFVKYASAFVARNGIERALRLVWKDGSRSEGKRNLHTRAVQRAHRRQVAYAKTRGGRA